MKNYLFVIVMLLVALSSGCSVYRAEREYKVAKLKKATEMVNLAQVASEKNGIISNMDRYRPIRIVIFDDILKEKKSYFLAPGQLLVEDLTDGKYTANVYQENRMIDTRNFEVNTKTHSYMGNAVYWYVVYSNNY